MHASLTAEPLPLAARLEIQDQMARWAMAVDRHDYDALLEVYTDGARYVSTNGTETVGAAAIVAWFKSRIRPGAHRVTRHGLSQVLLTPQADGSVSAHSVWHTYAANEPLPAGVPLFQVADFQDRWIEAEDGWRLAERVTKAVFRDESLAP